MLGYLLVFLSGTLFAIGLGVAGMTLPKQEISANLSVVVSQRLVRTLCPHCRVTQPPDEDERRWLDSEGLELPAEVWHPVDCDRCRQVGYAGRTAVFDAWRVDHDDYALLLDHADERRLQQHLADKGHHFLLDDALDKIAQGVTAIAEVCRMGYGRNPVAHVHSTRQATCSDWRRERRPEQGPKQQVGDNGG